MLLDQKQVWCSGVSHHDICYDLFTCHISSHSISWQENKIYIYEQTFIDMSQTEGSVYLSTGAFVYNIHIEYLSNGSNGNIYNLLNKSFEYLSNCPSTYLVMN